MNKKIIAVISAVFTLFSGFTSVASYDDFSWEGKLKSLYIELKSSKAKACIKKLDKSISLPSPACSQEFYKMKTNNNHDWQLFKELMEGESNMPISTMWQWVYVGIDQVAFQKAFKEFTIKYPKFKQKKYYKILQQFEKAQHEYIIIFIDEDYSFEDKSGSMWRCIETHELIKLQEYYQKYFSNFLHQNWDKIAFHNPYAISPLHHYWLKKEVLEKYKKENIYYDYDLNKYRFTKISEKEMMERNRKKFQEFWNGLPSKMSPADKYKHMIKIFNEKIDQEFDEILKYFTENVPEAYHYARYDSITETHTFTFHPEHLERAQKAFKAYATIMDKFLAAFIPANKFEIKAAHMYLLYYSRYLNLRNTLYYDKTREEYPARHPYINISDSQRDLPQDWEKRLDINL